MQSGDVLRATVSDAASGELIGKSDRVITRDSIRRAYLTFNLNFPDLAPVEARLLQNYPNPFNPETWMPYQLADGANVTICIYNSTGRLIRTLEPGYKFAGGYLNKDKAAYWDGKDDSGERVASGLYFYKLMAGNFSSMKKMVLVH